MALAVYDRIQETTATTGTGTVTLGGAVAGYQSFAAVGNGNNTYYTILDGTNWEVGVGTYSTTGPTLARTTILSSSNSGSAINLSGGAIVWCDYPAEKAIYYDVNGVATIGSTLSYSDTGIVASFASTVAGYNQVIIQNKSSSSSASSNFNISNDASTATTGYAELGINSSTYSGTGSFNIAGASYLASASTDLTIGTYGAYNIHFATNSGTTDAMTIFNDGGASLGGLGDPGIGNIAINNAVVGFTSITAAAGTTVLTSSSTQVQAVTGTTTQTIQLPQATTLLKGTFYTISNISTGLVTVKDNAGTTLETISTGGAAQFLCANNSTSAGTWGVRVFAASNTTWGNAALNYTGNITGATWQGTTIASGYGGTGLTTFTAANNAIYSTSASALTAGTLPVAAGGTGATSLTGYVYGNGTSAMTASTTIPTSALSGNFVSTFSAGTTGLTPSTATTGAVTLAGTLNIGNGGTGITSFGTGVQTALGNAVTGSGGIVLATSPTLVTPALGTPSSGNFSTGTFTWPTFNQNTTGSAGSVANAVTFNNGGTGGATGSTFNGASPLTVSYNTIGASPLAGSSSLTTVGIVTSGTWNAGVIGATYGGTGVAGTLTGISYMNGTAAHTAATGAQISSALGSTAIAGQAGSVANALTINNSGTGSVSGTTYNGSSAVTISYNSIGAQPAGTYVTSVTGTAPVVSSGGTTPAISMAAANTSTNGYLTSTDWNTFNGKAPGVTFTTNYVPYGQGTTTLNQSSNFTYNGTALGVTSTNATGSIIVTDTGTSGANIKLVGNGVTTPNKTIRAFNGNFAVVNNAYSSEILTLTDAGALTVPSSVTASNHIGAGTGLTGTASSLSIGGSAGSVANALTIGTGLSGTSYNGSSAVTIANAGVTSAVAGAGISVSGATGAVTITNSGVTSIVAGTGISVSGATGTVTVSSTASGATITGTTSAGTYYVVGTTSTSGTLSTASISNTNVVSYNASTGALSAVSHVSSSDERLKTDWEDLPVNFIELLSQVKHGVFTRISSGNKEVGVSAQSMRKAISQAVIENDEGMLAVNYGAAALVAAIELAKEVKALRAEIAALKAR
jgi:hypothetical protein